MSNAESSHNVGDKLRWWLAIGIMIAGVAANLYFVDTYPTIIRVLMVLAGVLIGGFLGYTTPKGKEFARFVRNANIERQKIVWPTKNETIQSTIIVIVMVLVISFFLFMLDTLFSNLVDYFFGS
ncbi:protein translocase subunit SecE [Marinicella pacifica]|jgi:preprotein translocase subunit SecE|uniref:Protein translocase subunit SecE n=1 Tax=Marinicella pacifica TaxID=1171543 RepID=A0A917CRP9_9GAMM|nr:preprotein translocase subunit SecE [Marinicella pacifica]GGF97280.1 protein translocase subunit SecE [Marinicella pacifica]